MPTFSKHGHGGQLTKASKQYGIPLSEWIDLSTGISPFTYPLPSVPDECWQRLPESNDGLETAAASYYGSEQLLPVSGSQEAIQKLPLLFSSPCNVGIITPAYHSHQHAWQSAGHNIVLLSPNEIESAVFSSGNSANNPLDILLLVNPTNPSTQTYTRDELMRWHKQLSSHNGCLIIDEAFIDSTPEKSVIEQTAKPGLIVMRSIGKFFGLAGIRLGFVWAETDVLERLALLQDDWSVSNPARWAGKMALEDRSWQRHQRSQLNKLSLRLKELLHYFLEQYASKKQPKSGGVLRHSSAELSFKEGLYVIENTVKHTTLFSYIEHPDSPLVHQALAQKGILTRLFNKSINDENGHKENALRFGLPANEVEWQRLEQALNQISNST